jgi:uncharacterized protein with von Willebrand factor type A (vWA) domain
LLDVALVREAAGQRLTRVDAPWTLRAAMREGWERIAVHLVNYRRDESKAAFAGGRPLRCY